MRRLRFTFVFFTSITFMALLYIGESGHGNNKKRMCHNIYHGYLHKVSNRFRQNIDDQCGDLKLPRILLRKFYEHSKAPRNFTFLYHSIPVTVEHMTDGFSYLTAPYRKTKTAILDVHLWMEFHDIEKSDELLSDEFLVDFIPIIGSQEMTEYDNDCSLKTIVSKPHFPDDVLEMKFDITSLYQACQVIDESPSFKYKVRFYSINNPNSINLIKDSADTYLIFKEEDDKSDIMSFLPNSQHIEPLHYDNVMVHKKPPLRSLLSRQKTPKACSLRPYVFNFEYSEWRQYVIAPKAYRSNKCHGRCAFPLAQHLNYTNYAIVKAIGSIIYKEMKNPSCIAQDLAPLMMLVFDEKNQLYTMKTQPDMIVTSCKCV